MFCFIFLLFEQSCLTLYFHIICYCSLTSPQFTFRFTATPHCACSDNDYLSLWKYQRYLSLTDKTANCWEDVFIFDIIVGWFLSPPSTVSHSDWCTNVNIVPVFDQKSWHRQYLWACCILCLLRCSSLDDSSGVQLKHEPGCWNQNLNVKRSIISECQGALCTSDAQCSVGLTYQ